MRTNRRVLLKLAAIHPVLAPLAEALSKEPRYGELWADVAIIGGGVGGVAAALAVARSGCRVVMTEPTDWIGGQLTSQAVSPDEHRWIESFGCTRLYRRFRDGVRAYYRNHYPLTADARAAKQFNPGNGSVSKLCCEPKVALAVLHELLAPYTSSGRVTILHETVPVSAEVERDHVRAVTVRDIRTGQTRVLTAKYFLDASEMGDLLPLTKTEYVTGAESQKQTGEPHAPTEAQPANHQAFTCCFAMDYLEGEDHTIEKPAEYEFWRNYTPDLRPAWPGRLLHWSASHPITLKERALFFNPASKPGTGMNLWLYRRIADRENFEAGTYPGDICLVNWPQNDYWLGNLCEVPEAEAKRHLDRGKQLSLSLLYWMQTEAPRPDGGVGWKGLRLRHDIVDTDDGLAKHAYIRESRRIKAEFTVLEQHVGIDARKKLSNSTVAQASERFADSVGVGSYRIDLHPSSGGDNYIDVGNLPFQIPLGALIPLPMENLLPACKNLGVTHITNGCYRLHPVEWNIGESTGLLATFCIAHGRPPRQVRNQPAMLAAFQKVLYGAGVEIQWPANLPQS